MFRKIIVWVFLLGLLPGFARADAGVGAGLLGGGGSNSNASPSIETDDFTGSATYSVQIPVPPARGGIQPNLSLTYSSIRRNHNSWVGLGWELDIGSIARLPAPVTHQHNTGIVDYGATGKAFQVRLGGQSEELTLVQEDVKGGDYGITSVAGERIDLYQAKVESAFTYYLHRYQMDGNLYAKDLGWVGIDKSGVRYLFGQTSNSQAGPLQDDSTPDKNEIQQWMLDEIRDVNGNNLIAQYDGNRLLTKILYQDIKIEFNLSTEKQAYFPSFREESLTDEQLGDVLDNITISSYDSRLQKFQFDFLDSSFRGDHYLASVRQYGASDSQALPPVKFQYFDESPIGFSNSLFSMQAGYQDKEGLVGESVSLVDMNGDGRPDQVLANEDGSFTVRYNNGNDFVEVPGKSNWKDPFICGGSFTDDPTCKGKLNAFRKGHQWLYLMDMNGDGLPDRVGRVIISNFDTDEETAHFRIAFNNGHGWDPITVEWLDPYKGHWAGTSDQDKGFADMNGDGLVDRVIGDKEIELPNGKKAKGFNVFYNTGTGFRKTPIFWRDPLSDFQTGDSAEGKLIFSDDDKTRVFIRDMNGDGLPDRVFGATYYEQGVEVGEIFAIAINTNGRGWTPLKLNAEAQAYVDGVNLLAILDPVLDSDSRGRLDKKHDWLDVNGDGFLDRVEGDSDKGIFRVYFYRGFQQLGKATNLSPAIQLNDPVSNDDWDGKGLIVGLDDDKQHTFFQDINGDGFPDRVKLNKKDPKSDSQYEVFFLEINAAEYSDSPSWWKYKRISQPVGLLKEVRDGRGQRMAIEYRPSSRPKDPEKPDHRFLPFNMNLVHKVYTLDPTLQTGGDFAQLPEAQRHPGMRWTTLDFRGGNVFVRHAKKASFSIYEDEVSQARFFRFNGFQEVKKTPVVGPGETWQPYASRSFYHQASGDVGPTDQEQNTLFDGQGYRHYALSGKPYREFVEQAGKVVVDQSSSWTVNGKPGSDLECEHSGLGAKLCVPQMKSQGKKVWEEGGGNLRQSHMAFEYDAVGNVAKQASYEPVNGSLVLMLKTESQYYPPETFQKSLQIRDRPQLQSKSDGKKLYRQKSFFYDERGNPVGETFFGDEQGGGSQFITRKFNTNGTLQAITDTDGTTKTLGYDAAGLFPITETLENAPNHLTTTRSFNRLSGETELEVSPQGVGKSVVKDDFGRPMEEYLHASSASGQPKQLLRRFAYDYVDLSLNDWSEIRLLKTTVWEPKPDYPELSDKPTQISYAGPSGEVYQGCQLTENGKSYRLVQYRNRNGGQEEIQTEPSYSETCAFLPKVNSEQHVFLEKKDLFGRTIYSEPPIGDAESPMGTVSIGYQNDNQGRLTKTITAPKGQVRVETYDVNDRLIKATDPGNAAIEYHYNPVGDLEKVYGQGELLTEIQYDMLGSKKTMWDSDLGLWSYQYDTYGRLWKQTDAKGQIQEQLYDSIGRLSRKNIYNEKGSLESFEKYQYDGGDAGYSVLPGELYQIEEFDKDQNLLRRTRSSYDVAYRRSEKVSREIAGLGEFTQSFAYDYLGRTLKTIYPGGHSFQFSYMANGNLQRLCGNSCDESGDIYYSLDPDKSYDVFGSLLSEQYGNGVISDYEYYPNSHRLKSKKTHLGTTVYSERNYAHDELSNITLIGDPLNQAKNSGSGGIETTQYDHLNRLTGYKLVGASKAEVMEYEANGNVKKNTASFGEKEYKYEGPHRHAVTSIGEDKYEYDANGNMTKDPHRVMVYDGQNQLTQVAMTNKTLVEYDYDSTGARVSKQVTREDPLSKSFQAKTYYLGDAMEIRGDAMILNVYAGSRKVATRYIGKITDGLGGGSALMINGIDLKLRPVMAMPYLLLCFSLLVLVSFRPMRIRISYRPNCSKVLIQAYRGWRWYQEAIQETAAALHRRAGVKGFLVFYVVLFLVQTVSAPAFAGETGDIETPPSDSEFFYYNHDDHLGSSQLLTEGKSKAKHAGISYKKGELLQRFEYSPFGEERYVLNPNLKFDPSYTGQLYDVETGLYYYKSRYYNPLIARFIQADTVIPDAKNLQAYNRYSYVANNPLKFVDPTGHFWGFFKKILAAFIGAFISALTFGLLAGPILAAGLALTLGQTLVYGVVAGIAGGLISGAITGGLKGALLGAVMGGIGGLAVGAAGFGLTQAIGKWGAFAVLSGIGLSMSGATGGWRGLVIFGAGMLGGLAGGYASKYSPRRSSGTEGRSQGSDSKLEIGETKITKGDEIVLKPKVREGMEKAFLESGDGKAYGDGIHEQGGWIKKDGEIIRWPEGTPSTIEIPNEIPKGVVARFHTHPYSRIERFEHMPSPNDFGNAKSLNMPSFIIDRIGIMRVEPATKSFHNVILR